MTYTDEFMEWLAQSDLTDRNKAAALMRSKGLTLRSIGESLGVGPERIRQMCAKAERRFRDRNRVAEKRAALDEAMNARREHWESLRSTPWFAWDADCVELGVRASNIMKNEGWTLGSVDAASDAEILRIPNCGRKTLNELRAAVAKAKGVP